MDNKAIKAPKAILRWAGGKNSIISKITPEFPSEMNNYHEPFLGGGSVLLNLITLSKNGMIKINGGIFAYDLNDALINVYKNIQSNKEGLYEEITKIIAEFKELSGDVSSDTSPELPSDELSQEGKDPKKKATKKKSPRELYYYQMRSKYNVLTDEEKRTTFGSALFIFLNKTCFRGLYRVSKNGFNVPYGHYKNPEIINKAHLDEVSELIQGVVFECLDFEKSLEMVKNGDYVYLDPPYAPENDKSFVAYTEGGFGPDKHAKLFEMIHAMDGAKMMMSNADVPLVREAFADYKIISLVCKRAINSKKPDSVANEVLVKNY
jgi:DNA adenine methylase